MSLPAHLGRRYCHFATARPRRQHISIVTCSRMGDGGHHRRRRLRRSVTRHALRLASANKRGRGDRPSSDPALAPYARRRAAGAFWIAEAPNCFARPATNARAPRASQEAIWRLYLRTFSSRARRPWGARRRYEPEPSCDCDGYEQATGWAAMKASMPAAAIPAKVSENERAIVTAGLAMRLRGLLSPRRGRLPPGLLRAT